MPIPEKETEVTLSMPGEMLASIDRISVALGRSRDDVLRGALADYLAGEGADILDDADGLDDLDNGRSVDADLVVKDARALIAKAEKQRAAKAG